MSLPSNFCDQTATDAYGPFEENLSMIGLSRHLAKQTVTVFRQALELNRRQLPTQLVELIAGPSGLTIRAAADLYAAQYQSDVALPQASLVMSLDLLHAISGSKQTAVTLTDTADGDIVASWQEGAIPQQKQAKAASLTNDYQFPALPNHLAENPPEMLQALRDAVAVTDRESTRYALGCLQLRGSEGAITATDGRQVLKQTGYQCGFEEELLVPGSKVFTCAVLPSDKPVQVGRTAEQVVVRIGPWTFWLPIEKDTRFPRIDDVIPRAELSRSRLTLSTMDREFLASSLPQLPCDDPQHEPVTLDLNGKVLVRARGEAGGKLTELVLSNSTKTGDDLRMAMNRKFLAQAMRMGFEQLQFVDPAAPAMATDERRTYVWAVLDKDSQLMPAEDAMVIPSPLASARPLIQRRPKTRPVPNPKLPQQHTSRCERVGRVDPPSAPPASNTSLVEQVMQLRQSLRMALAQTGELLRALKRQKKQEQAFKSTLASLRQLQIPA